MVVGCAVLGRDEDAYNKIIKLTLKMGVNNCCSKREDELGQEDMTAAAPIDRRKQTFESMMKEDLERKQLGGTGSLNLRSMREEEAIRMRQ